MNHAGVDIIIPVYNAYDDLVKCINSVKKWTDFSMHRLVLINDCSSDMRVGGYLDGMRKDGCIVIHNEKNKGFAANINIGIAQSQDRDVVLLNSDTVVTKNWVEKLQRCAYSDLWAATATPLSNHAGLCSVPDFFKENKLPEGYAVDEYAELIERASLKKYPRIPVANGFCMLIKREIIQVIGNFDEETFQRGYGEENDFCYRAILAGWHHVMCDDTFILHTGTSSFADADKRKYMAEHEKILDKRYPHLVREVQIYIRDNPSEIIRQNIRMHTELAHGREKKTVMYLLQSDFREDADDHIGGTQLHVKDLTDGLRQTYNIVVAARNYDYLNVTFYSGSKELFFQFYIGAKQQPEALRSGRYAQLYGRILDAFKVAYVHIHHAIGMSLELYYEAARRQIPTAVTLHDYYYVCPNSTLLDENNQLCIGRKKKNCEKCLNARMGIAEPPDYIERWRKQHHEALKMAGSIFVPSQAAGDVIAACYPDLKERLTVNAHGVRQAPLEKSVPFSEKKSFHAAFLGAVSEAKGFQYAAELILKGSGIDWYLFGYFGRKVPELEQSRNFHDMGCYQREDLPGLIKENEIDLICILPLCAETFCYTLSEAVMAGVPVLAFDTGALGERVRAMDCGWLVPYPSTSDEVLSRILSLKENKEEYQDKLQKVKRLRLKTDVEMCADYSLFYEKAWKENRCRHGKADNEWLAAGHFLLEDKETEARKLQERLDSVQRQLNEVYGSFSYRAAAKLRKMPVPFRRQVRRILKDIFK